MFSPSSKLKSDTTSCARITSVIILFISTGCCVVTSFVYYAKQDSSLLITVTKPFVDFGKLPDFYYNILTLQNAVRVNKTLLDWSKCTSPTSNFRSHPENQAAACVCINNKYAGLMRDLTKNTLQVPQLLAIWDSYLQTPWITNSLGLHIAYACQGMYNESTQTNLSTVPAVYTRWLTDNPSLTLNYTFIQTSLLALNSTYNTPITVRTDIDYWARDNNKCIKERSVWAVSPYVWELHPVVLSFYISYALVMIAYSYVFRVASVEDTGSWAKYYLFIVSVFPVGFLFFMNTSGNWIYAVAIIIINVSLVTTLSDEFQTIEDISSPGSKADCKFAPPNPLNVAMWYYMVIQFPVIVVYAGMQNLSRDIMCLLGYYVLAYIVAFCIQKYVWTNWYCRGGVKIETYLSLQKSESMIMSEKMSGLFRGPIQTYLGITIMFVYLFTLVIIFLQWYNQSFFSGNWIALVCILMYGAIFLIMLVFSSSACWGVSIKNPHSNQLDNALEFSMADMIQAMLLTTVTILFTIATITDASIV